MTTWSEKYIKFEEAVHHNEELPRLLQLEEAHAQQWRPRATKN